MAGAQTSTGAYIITMAVLPNNLLVWQSSWENKLYPLNSESMVVQLLINVKHIIGT